MATYGFLGVGDVGLAAAWTNLAALRMPSFDGEAFTRPMLRPFFVGSDEIGRSSTMAVSEPTDFESWIMLLGFFF